MRTRTVETEGREPHHEEKYLVFKQGTLWKARNGDTGKIESPNADPETVIQYALDHQTSGRTWQDKIVVKGHV